MIGPAPYYNDGLDGVSCTSGRNCLAVGWTDLVLNLDCPAGYAHCLTIVAVVERWNGHVWQALSGMPMPAAPTTGGPVRSGRPGPIASDGPYTKFSAVSCATRDSCEAVGQWGSDRSHSTADSLFADRWNGSEWRLQSLPLPENASDAVVDAMSCRRASCLAVGSYTASGHSQPLVERWTPDHWTRLAFSARKQAAHAVLTGVACGTAWGCEVVGRTGGSGSTQNPLAVAWRNGRWTWQPVQTPPGSRARHGTGFVAVACGSARSCYAVGDYHKRNPLTGFDASWFTERL